MISLSKGSRQPKRLPWTLDRLVHERSIALGASIDKSTFKNYTSALNSYLTFCKLHNFAIDPTPDTLSYYTVYMSHHIKPDSVDNYLSGICNQLEYHFPDIRKNRNSRLVANTLAGCKRMRGTPTSRKIPLTRAHLIHIYKSLPPIPSHDDLLFAAQIFTGFAVLLRLGELTNPDAHDLRNSRKVSMRWSVKWYSDGFGFFLPGHKADRFFEGNSLIIQSHDGLSNPVPIFKNYLASRDALFPFHPQLWIRSNGTVPTRSWFIKRLRHFFTDSSIAGQSMRAGGATDLAESGALPYVIQAAGRWASDAFQVYIRKNPFILQGLIHSRPQNTAM